MATVNELIARRKRAIKALEETNKIIQFGSKYRTKAGQTFIEKMEGNKQARLRARRLREGIKQIDSELNKVKEPGLRKRLEKIFGPSRITNEPVGEKLKKITPTNILSSANKPESLSTKKPSIPAPNVKTKKSQIPAPNVKKKAPKAPLSFSQVFAQKRKELGPGKVFTYKGKKYTTDRKDDKKKSKAPFKMVDPNFSKTETKPRIDTFKDINKPKRKPTISGTKEARERKGIKAPKERYQYYGKPGTFLGDLSRSIELKYDTRPDLAFGEDYASGEGFSENKKGGRIGKKKAGCIKGMGKALKGF